MRSPDQPVTLVTDNRRTPEILFEGTVLLTPVQLIIPHQATHTFVCLAVVKIPSGKY